MSDLARYHGGIGVSGFAARRGHGLGVQLTVILRRRTVRKALRWLLPVLVIAAAGATVWLALLDGADLPTLNYDGDAVTYQGPLVFEQREVAFKLVNDSLQYAEFAYGVITDDSITLEDDIAWAKTHLDGHPP